MTSPSPHPPAGLSQRVYGTLPDGRVVHEFTLSNGTGLVLSAITLAGIVNTLSVPGRDGVAANVVRGFDNLGDYVERNPHFGVIVGRYANRIALGELTIDGVTHALVRNDGTNSLHGGRAGFGTQLWEIVSTRAHDAALGGPALTLRYVSPDGEQGFPGRVESLVTYSLGADQTWRVDYEATTDRATVVNLSHHDYFNLAGSGSAMDHVLTLPASRYNPVDADLIPTRIAEVAGTPFDFRSPTAIRLRLHDEHAQLRLAGGYDHNWIVDAPANGAPRLAAFLEDPVSGRTMALHTTEPALQFYSGNLLDGSLRGPGGEVYERGAALCLEPQHSPDSPHHPEWPTTVLRPGEVYRSTSIYRFGVNASVRAGTA
ncbi:MAG: aldose epimerase family protein [Betaproteobacteria bacterium]